jgi:hypothetical protein
MIWRHAQIAVLDVAAVLAQMDDDPGAAGSSASVAAVTGWAPPSRDRRSVAA